MLAGKSKPRWAILTSRAKKRSGFDKALKLLRAMQF